MSESIESQWLVMTARTLCWPLAILFYHCNLDLFYFFFRCLISKIAWLIVPNFATCFMVIQIYKIRLEIWVTTSPRNLAAKNIKFWQDFAQRRDLIANISGMQQDIISRKMANRQT